MQTLSESDIDSVSGGFSASAMFNDMAAGFAGAAAMSGTLALVPSPASIPLGAFAGMTGIMSAGSWYIADHLSN